MKLVRFALLAVAGLIGWRVLRSRGGNIAPRFQFLDPHTAGFTGLGGARFDMGAGVESPAGETRSHTHHSSAASAANDPGGYRDDRDVVGGSIAAPAPFTTEEH